jgi:hypothetical protein
MFMSISRIAQAGVVKFPAGHAPAALWEKAKAAEQRRPPKLFGKLFQI